MDKTSLENDPVFELFSKHWALVSTGTMEKHNACTVSWGSFGILWGKTGEERQDDHRLPPSVPLYLRNAEGKRYLHRQLL